MKRNLKNAASALAAFFVFLLIVNNAIAQEPRMLVRGLSVRPVAGGFVTPISIAFIGRNDFLLLEKNTGRVKRVVNGVVQSTVLDLAVNNASERGLLGIALHPNFPSNPGVYLFWSCRTSVPPDADPFFPSSKCVRMRTCLETIRTIF